VTSTENTFIPTSNPYVSNEREAVSLNADVMALFRVGSLLLKAEHVQVPAIDHGLRLLGQGSREGTRALVWEVCNVIREHAENGIDIPPAEAGADCPCGRDHGQRTNAYNAFLADAKSGNYQAAVDYIDNIAGRDAYDDLLLWVGAAADSLGDIRYGA
jgi:hypothetical protein